jgi:hypothetical protein
MLDLGDVLPIDAAPYLPARFENVGASHA